MKLKLLRQVNGIAVYQSFDPEAHSLLDVLESFKMPYSTEWKIQRNDLARLTIEVRVEDIKKLKEIFQKIEIK